MAKSSYRSTLSSKKCKKSKETISDKPVYNILVTIAGALSIVMVSSTYL